MAHDSERTDLVGAVTVGLAVGLAVLVGAVVLGLLAPAVVVAVVTVGLDVAGRGRGGDLGGGDGSVGGSGRVAGNDGRDRRAHRARDVGDGESRADKGQSDKGELHSDGGKLVLLSLLDVATDSHEGRTGW